MTDQPTLLRGDCMEVLRDLEPDSVDSCVTDPPYGLSFMGKHWDKGVPDAGVWREVYRVLKPGAHLLSFFGTRTYHRGVTAIEDAGFEIRDQIAWLYGSGFPKSLDIAKQDGCEAWDGWGTALKPAMEPIVVARKPLSGTVANNVLEWGTGGLNIDGCRIATDAADARAQLRALSPKSTAHTGGAMRFYAGATDGKRNVTFDPTQGRFPANVIHDGSDEVLAEFAKYGESKGKVGMTQYGSGTNSVYGSFDRGPQSFVSDGINDTGTAARFFYSSKAGQDERWSILTCDCETVKPGEWVSQGRNQSNQTGVTSQQKGTSEEITKDGYSCSTSTSGSEPTNPSQMDTNSTTGTETSSTTGSQTSNSSHPRNTSESTAGVSGEMASGGSRASSAAITSPSAGDGTSQKKAGPSTGVAVSATYAKSLRGKNCAVCGNARVEGHPTQKPISLMRYLVRLVTPKDGLVLDPFAGSGSTLIAAYREGCRAIGIERDPDYHKMAAQRVERMTAQMRLGL